MGMGSGGTALVVEGSQEKTDVNERTAEKLEVLKKRVAGASLSKMVASAIYQTTYSDCATHTCFKADRKQISNCDRRLAA